MELVHSDELWATFLNSNGYFLHHCIGSGSFGDVYSVTKAATGVQWALKRLVSRRKISEDKYTMAEIRALIDLNHPNVVGLEEVILFDRLACIVLELAPGGNLEMMIAACPANDGDVFIQIAWGQILKAVEFCHRAELAHRDINPSNILVFGDNLVKLADFGLCVSCRDPQSGDVLLCEDYLGQEAYLAPEVMSHQPFLAKPADVWSLGRLLFFMCRGVSPPTSELEFFRQTEKLRAVENDVTTLRFAHFVCKLCKRNTEERPSVSETILLWNT